MIFTIEPMVNAGRPDVTILPDGWTTVTRDRAPSAQFEHSLGVTEDGVEVFTLGSDRPPGGSVVAKGLDTSDQRLHNAY